MDHFEIVIGYSDGTTVIKDVETFEECIVLVREALSDKDVVFVEIEPWKC